MSTHLVTADLDIEDFVKMGDEVAIITEIRASRAWTNTFHISYRYWDQKIEHTMTVRHDTPYERLNEAEALDISLKNGARATA